MDTSVTVVIVHRRQPTRCLVTIEAFLRQVGLSIVVVVVDNGSPTVDLDQIRLAHPSVPLIELGTNTGFGPAANAGLGAWLHSTGQNWVFVAPHDALPAPDALRLMVEAGESSPDIGLVSADVGDDSRAVLDPYFGGMTVPRDPASDGSQLLDVDYPHGTLFGARRECLLDIGLFDERYFAYCEEADLGARARARGWRVVLALDAEVRNPSVSPGAPAIDYLQQRNTIQLVGRRSGGYHATIRWLIGAGHLVMGVVSPGRQGFVFYPRARLRALVDVLRGRVGPPPARLFSDDVDGAEAGTS